MALAKEIGAKKFMECSAKDGTVSGSELEAKQEQAPDRRYGHAGGKRGL